MKEELELREAQRKKNLDLFDKLPLEYRISPGRFGGMIIVDERFEVTLRTLRWRNLGKAEWYRMKSPEHWYENYIKEDEET
jgi:hypothetical protein